MVVCYDDLIKGGVDVKDVIVYLYMNIDVVCVVSCVELKWCI